MRSVLFQIRYITGGYLTNGAISFALSPIFDIPILIVVPVLPCRKNDNPPKRISVGIILGLCKYVTHVPIKLISAQVSL